MPRPYDITIFSTTGDPSGIRHVSKSNWSGLGVVFPREQFAELTDESCLDHAGVYILVDDVVDETIYIGEADPIGRRLKDHLVNKKNWSWCVYFVEKHGFIGKTEIKYIEAELITIAKRLGVGVENKNSQNQPTMASVNKARAQAFLEDMLLILPMLGIRSFSKPPKAAAHPVEEQSAAEAPPESSQFDTIVVPAREEGFTRRFLGEDCWFAIRINKKHLPKIKYIAAYQVAPVAAITHYARVKKIEPYGDTGKYKLLFHEPARTIGPVQRGESTISMQSSRYAQLDRITGAKSLDDVWP